jgi:hypothetical protein
MKGLKKKMGDWWESFKSGHHLFIKRLVEYFKWLVWFTPVYLLIVMLHYLFPTHSNSARAILSTLVQSEAAIVAIVISLTLVAVELTASAYSPRVVDTFIKDPDMRILLILYGISIFYDLVVLRLVKEGGDSIGHSLEWLVSIALCLGAFTFVALYPYIKNTITLLKPAKIIERLEEDISPKKMLTYIKLKEEYLFSWDNVPETDGERLLRFLSDDLDICWAENAEISKSDDGKTIHISKDKISAKITINEKKEKAILKIRGGRTHDLKVKKEDDKLNIYKEETDPVQPIVDIIHKSVNNYDLETARVGLDAVVRLVSDVIDSKNVEKKKISKYFCTHLQRVGKLAATIENEDSTKEVIEKLKNFEKETRETTEAARHVADSLGAIGEVAAEKKLKDATKEVITNLETIGKTNTELGHLDKDVTWRAVVYLEAVGEAAAEKRLKDATESATSSLGVVGEAAAKIKEFKGVTERAVVSLEIIGKSAAERRLKDATDSAVSSLLAIVKIALVNELENVTEQAASSLAALSISNEIIKNVKTIICNYKSEIESDSARNSVQKFETLYEQTLKKFNPLHEPLKKQHRITVQ